MYTATNAKAGTGPDNLKIPSCSRSKAGENQNKFFNHRVFRKAGANPNRNLYHRVFVVNREKP